MTTKRTIILGVAASDAHAVANHLIAHYLRARGFEVVNLGTCTPIAEFARAYDEHPDAEAVVIGSLNGHVHEDLRELRQARVEGRLPCPVIVGGNLSVGSHKDESAVRRLHELGVDHILREPGELPDLLDRLRTQTERRSRPLSRVS
ncbi:MAG TPA: cobalamin-dependent protein [Candidatus Dormibacteraeota bacterium]|nr:cobalamin-dependent protein [Candidatus Dormibacteraeota bacterium]